MRGAACAWEEGVAAVGGCYVAMHGVTCELKLMLLCMPVLPVMPVPEVTMLSRLCRSLRGFLGSVVC